MLLRDESSSIQGLKKTWEVSHDTVKDYLVFLTQHQEVPGVVGQPEISDFGRNWFTLSWEKPVQLGPAPALAYRVEASSLTQPQWTEVGITPAASLDVFNLKGEYRFRVSARNRYGWGQPALSDPLDVTSDLELPQFLHPLPGPLKTLLGQPVSLRCQVKGVPKPDIKWYKNGHPLLSDPRVGESEDGWSELRIKSGAEEDEGRYSCEATNSLGRVTTSARLELVSDPSLLTVDEKPTNSTGEDEGVKFSMGLRDRRVEAMYPVRLTCQVAPGLSHPIVTWTKDGQQITPDERHVLEEGDSGFHTLEILCALEEDSGEYEVVAESGRGGPLAVSRAELTVARGHRDYAPPVFTSPLQPPQELHEGQDLRLRTKVEAYPPPTVLWERDGCRVRSSRAAVMTLDREGWAELSLACVRPKDEGVYTCTACNPLGKAALSCSLTVLPLLPQGEADVQQQKSPIPYSKAPLFVTKPRSTEAVEGDTIEMLCEVVGDPTPEVRWLRDWLKPEYYRDGKEFRRVGEGPEYRLEIPQVKLDYTGAYSLIATNIHGEAKAVISLQIYAKGQGREQNMDNRPKKGEVETLPMVTRPLRDLSCSEGDAVVLQCRLKATPPPDVWWEKNSRILKIEGDLKSWVEGDTASLSIGRVYPDDQGEYTCVAYNPLGKATTSARLIVNNVPEGKESGGEGTTAGRGDSSGAAVERSGSPSVTRTGHREWSGVGGRARARSSCPRFYSVPHNRLAEEGETVRFMCAAAGLPEPFSSWDKDGRLLATSSRLSLTERGDTRVLEIREVAQEDAGIYRVTLDNGLGRVEASARLEVMGRNGLSSRALKALGAARASPSFSRKLVSSTARVGGDFTLACDIQATPSPVTTWYRNGEVVERSSRAVPTWDGRTARLELHGVEAEDGGVYTCVADGPSGRTRCSACLTVLQEEQESPQDLHPPVFLAGLPEETVAQEGHPLELQIRIEGAEPLEVVWLKDKVEIPDCADFHYVDYGEGRSGLRICDLFAPDAGEYSCEVSNPHGDAVTSTSLRVIDDGFSEDVSVLRPQRLWFTKTPAPVLTSYEHTAVFSARVSWLDNIRPSFRWEVGGNPVPPRSSRYKVTDNGEETTLEITDVGEEDVGLIKVRAEWCKEKHDALERCAECEVVSASAELRLSPPEGKPASLVRGPADTTALRGDRVILKAVYAGYPHPSVRWLKAGKELTSGSRIKIHTLDGVSSLTLDPVMADDSGKYVICIENLHGTDCHFASVAVEGCPDPPAGLPSVNLGEGGVVTVAWSSPPYDGGCMVTGYSVEMSSAGKPNWTVVADRCHCLSHTVRDLTPGEMYTFRVRSHNVHGPSDPGVQSAPITIGAKEEEICSLVEHKVVEVEAGDFFKLRYDVSTELGKGRYGVVKRVTDLRTGLTMAAKFIRCIKKQDREKADEEIDIMNCLRHPKLLQLAAAYESPKELIMVVEYLSGGELFERVVADDFDLTEKDCILFMRQICEGVDYMHKNSIVHLDLKPENIMCHTRTSHQIKVIDFGLAKKLDPNTPCKVLFGTPEFIPPEIINYEPIGIESDMWSVGVICYVLLSGLSPFMGDNDAETFANITRADYDFNDEAFVSISHDAKEFISALLVKRKEKRLSAEECLRNRWMTQQDTSMSKVRLCTDKLKTFIVRRKWQKTWNAIRAVGRMATLSAASRRNSNGSGGSGGGSGGGSPRPSLSASRMSSLGEEESLPGGGEECRPQRARACSERSDSGISDCSSSAPPPLLFDEKFSITEEQESPKSAALNGFSSPSSNNNNNSTNCSGVVSPTLARASTEVVAGEGTRVRSPALRRDAKILSSDNIHKAFAFWNR